MEGAMQGWRAAGRAQYVCCIRHRRPPAACLSMDIVARVPRAAVMPQPLVKPRPVVAVRCLHSSLSEQMFRVKICGITTPEDAIIAARAGADAVGLNFFP